MSKEKPKNNPRPPKEHNREDGRDQGGRRSDEKASPEHKAKRGHFPPQKVNREDGSE
jgi:hypothetical protein